jgi:hypothetical protein
MEESGIVGEVGRRQPKGNAMRGRAFQSFRAATTRTGTDGDDEWRRGCRWIVVVNSGVSVERGEEVPSNEMRRKYE